MNTTTPKRHGCLTSFLVWMIVINSLALATYVLAKGTVSRASGPGFLPPQGHGVGDSANRQTGGLTHT
jgi:hypothetical protein